MGRFINADGYASTGQGIKGNNMFAYCGNNPIINSDATGTMYIREAGFGGGGGGGAGAVAVDTSSWGYTNVINYFPGGGSGAVVAGGLTVVVGSSMYVSAEMLDDPRYEHVKLRRKQALAFSVMPSQKEEKGKVEPEPPDVTYPGDDPLEAPEGTVWKGRGTQGSKQGNYHNPETGESWHPDLDHPEPIGPHWDYKDPSGIWWRISPDGDITIKWG